MTKLDLGLRAYGPVPHSMLVTLGRMIGGTPGLRVISVGMTEHDENASLNVVLEGWGPSLHAQEIAWGAEVIEAGDGSRDWQSTIAGFASLIDEQRQRSLAGMHHGLLSPLPIDDDDLELRHLAVDADWLHLVLGKSYAAESVEDLLDPHNGELIALRRNFLNRTATVVRDLLNRTHDGGPFCQHRGTFVGETPYGRMTGAMVYVTGPKGAEVCFNGLTVDVFGLELPPSVLEALVGRKASTVRPVHPLLDERIILNAECEGGHLHLDLEPRPLGIATLHDVD